MKLLHVSFAVILSVGLAGLACSPSDDTGGSGSGGHGSGGSGSGGSASGGSGSGGSGSGGSASGGSSSGGSGSGGSASGGSGSGGKGSGGSASGGSSSGGSGSGGSGSGGTASGGSGEGGGSAQGGSGPGNGGAAGRGSSGGKSGGGGMSGGGGSSGSGSFTDVATLLGKSCGTGTCHDGTAHVDLRNTTGLYDRLKGSPAGSGVMSACKSMKLVVPNDASTSVLSKIVKAAVSGCSSARMPDDCSTSSSNPRACLTTAQINMIDSWIAAGAPM